MNALEAALKITDAEINRIQQQALRGGHAMAPVDPLARNVAGEIGAGRVMEPAEYGVLQQRIPEAILDLVRQHPELLLLKRGIKTVKF
ncbi:MAG TPA: hypothetical protein VMD25_12645 [Acidobacteriaceae bacterium]|nr:hypothetical protein [Acidobacteriaceae bacterium]